MSNRLHQGRRSPAETSPGADTQPRGSRSWRYGLAAILLLVSAVLYAVSLTMNVAMVETKIQVMAFSKSSTESVKLLSTIRTLWEQSEMILVVLITAFTIVFPIGKYLALVAVLRSKNPATSRPLSWVKNFGQWSMGDVFVVALLVVILRVNSAVGQLHVFVEPGLYVFAASVLTSMIVSTLLIYERGTGIPEEIGDQRMKPSMEAGQ